MDYEALRHVPKIITFEQNMQVSSDRMSALPK